MTKDYLSRQFVNYHSITEGYITPEMFGAVGDGIEDDSQAFINACEYAMTSKKRVVKLTKKYRLKQKISITGDKFLHLRIEGNAICGSNSEQSKFLESPMNIIAEGNEEGGLTFGSYITLKNVGFIDYGVRVAGIRVKFENCVFNRCDKAITLRSDYSDESAWLGEIMIDGCNFGLCNTCVNAEAGEKGEYYKDSRISDCIAIHGGTFLLGKISAWQIFNNHIYTDFSFKDLNTGSVQVSNNYFDTNRTAINITVRSGICQFSNNLFLKSTVYHPNSDTVAEPVCKVVGNATTSFVFENNTCTKEYNELYPNETFVEFSGDGKFAYSGNVSKINFTNNNVTIDRAYCDTSNLIIMPKYSTPSEMRTNKIIDKPLAVLTFDGWNKKDVETIAPYLYEKGIPFTVFMGKNDSIDNTTSEDLQALHTLKNYGGEVQFYTSQPKDTFVKTTNYVEQYTQLMQAYNKYISWGFGKPRFCAYSGGVTSEILDNLLHGLGIKAARTTANHDNITTELYGYPSLYLKEGTYRNFANTLNGWATQKIPALGNAHGLYDEEAGHIDPDTYITWETMKAMIDSLVEIRDKRNVTFMKFSEFWDYIHFPRNAKVGQHCLIWESDGQHEYVKTENGWVELNLN